MKKIFMVIALMAMLMLPFTSFSMTALEDGDLSSVTGQAGVSINLDARVDLTADVVAWGDADGITSGTYTNNAGWVGLTGLDIANLRVRADQTLLEGEYFLKHGGAALSADLTTAATTLGTELGTWLANPNALPAGLSVGFNPTQPTTWTADEITILVTAGAIQGDSVVAYQAAYGAITGSAVAAYFPSAATMSAEIAAGQFTPFAPLTIDVATGDATNAYHGVGVTFVRIGLGSLQIAMDSMDANVNLGPTAAGVPDMKYTLGSLYLADLALRIGGDSYVDIFTARGADTQGVSIYADATIKGLSIGTLAWGDTDGIDWSFKSLAGDTPGTVKLHTELASFNTPDTSASPEIGTAGWVGLKDVSIARILAAGQVDIDVGTTAGGLTAVQISLGDGVTPFNAKVYDIQATAALGAAETSLDQELGEIYVDAMDVDVSGALSLGARADSQGVTIDLSGLTIAINNDLTASWGDLDGYAGAANAGYVGLKNLNIDGLTLTGKVSIDVATIGTDVDTITATNITDMMYAGYVENNLSPTFVHIGLGAGDPDTDVGALEVGITTLSAEVVFANNAKLAGVAATSPNYLARTMGSLYIGNLDVKVNGWVDIAAH